MSGNWTDEDLVTADEFSARLGYSRWNAQHLRESPGFPERTPVKRGRNHTWRWGDVHQWAVENGRVGRDDPNLVSVADIADRYDVGKPTVTNWARRYPSFPKPVIDVPHHRRWRLDEVAAWCAANNKPGQQVAAAA